MLALQDQSQSGQFLSIGSVVLVAAVCARQLPLSLALLAQWVSLVPITTLATLSPVARQWFVALVPINAAVWGAVATVVVLAVALAGPIRSRQHECTTERERLARSDPVATCCRPQRG